MFTHRITASLRAATVALALVAAPAAVLIATAPAAHAEGNKEWTGEGSGGLWSDDANWSGNEAPKDGDSVSIASPDSKGGTVHVVGAPQISLDSLSITASGGATVSVSGAGFDVAGSFSWTSGTLDADVSLGPLAHGSIGSGGAKYLQGDLSAGPGSALTMSGVSGTSALTMDDPHTISISTGAAFATIGDNRITALNCCVSPARFVNNGLLEQGPGTFELSGVEFDQFGRLDASFGPTFTVDSAPVKIASSARFSGTGRMVMGTSTATRAAGTVKIGGNYVVEQSGGTLEGAATLTNGGRWQLTGGVQYASLTNAAGNLFEITGPNDKSFGNVGATVHGGVVNHGVVEASGAKITMAAGTRIVNADDGELRFVPGVTVSGLSCCVTPALIENHGHLSVTAPATAGEPVRPVTLEYASLYSNAAVAITSGQTLELADGPSELSAPAVVGGGGTLGVASDLVVDGAVAVQAGSTVRLHGGADVVGNGAVLGGPGSTVRWEAGAIAGHVGFPAGTALDLAAGGTKYVAGPAAGDTIVTTAGTTALESGVDSAHRNELNVAPGARWVNSGVMTIGSHSALRANSCCVAPARLENVRGATLDLVPAPATTVEVEGVEVHNLGGRVRARSGIVNVRYPSYVQESGTTVVDAGALFGQTNFSSTMQLLGGTVTGTGTLTGTIDNVGATLAPGRSAARGALGTLNVSGEYHQGPGGRLVADISALRSDRLASGGAVRLAGIVTGVAKGGDPADGAHATVITGSTVIGTPDCTFTDGTTARQWSAATTSTALTLTAGAPGPTGCDVFTPLAPTRLDGSGTTVDPTQDGFVQVTGIAGVPADGVDAVSLTVSVDGAIADGTLTVGPGTTPTARFHAGRPVSNAVTVRPDGAGRVRLRVTGSAATVHVDVAGWYGDAQRTAGGSLFHPVTAAVVRTVAASAAADTDVVVAGRAGVPAHGITSVTLAVEIHGGDTAGALAVLPGGAAVGATTTQSFGAKHTVQALVTVAPVDGTVRLHLSAGTARVTIRAVGYTTARADGGSYLKVTGPANVDAFGVGTVRTVDVIAGLAGISRYGASAYLLTVHVLEPSSRLTVFAGSAASGAAQVPVVTVRAPLQDASGALLTRGDVNDAIQYATDRGTARARIDLQGWYVG